MNPVPVPCAAGHSPNPPCPPGTAPAELPARESMLGARAGPLVSWQFREHCVGLGFGRSRHGGEGWGGAEPALPRPCPEPAWSWRQQLLVLTKASSRGNCQPRDGSGAARKGASPHEGASGTRSGDAARAGRPPPFPVTVPPASSPGHSPGLRHGALGAAKICAESSPDGCSPSPPWGQHTQESYTPGVLSPAGDIRDPQPPRGVCRASRPSAFQDKSPSR